MNISVLIAALIAVESGGDNKATGDKGQAVGCLQIHPIFVEDVNLILGEKFYFDTDRVDRMKSMEMARIWLIYYSARFEMNEGRRPTYQELALMYNRGPTGFRRMEQKDYDLDPYWIKVEAALTKLGDW